MKISAVALGVGAMLAAGPTLARDHVLLDAGKAPANQTITSKSLGVKSATPFTVTTKTLHGGRQEGVMLVEIDTGAMKITVVPTRGMNVLQAVAGDVRLGWHSPVKEVVNPSFIELTGRNGLGWLEGFNELVTRCGYEWVGHPGKATDSSRQRWQAACSAVRDGAEMGDGSADMAGLSPKRRILRCIDATPALPAVPVAGRALIECPDANTDQ